MADHPNDASASPAHSSSHYVDLNFPVEEFTGAGDILARTFATFFQNLGPITLITLAVFGPFELLKNVLLYATNSQDTARAVRWELLLQAGCGALVAPAVTFALVIRLRDGRTATVGEALHWGKRHWGRTLLCRFLAGLAVSAGLILLLVPGIVFWIWFFLIDQVVALEGPSRRNVLRRSRQLIRGHGWEVFGAALVLGIVNLLFAVLVAAPLAFLDTWYISTFSDCLIDVAWESFTVMCVLTYVSIVARLRVGCPTCGYDLTGNMSGICPECGIPVPAHLRRGIGLPPPSTQPPTAPPQRAQ